MRQEISVSEWQMELSKSLRLAIGADYNRSAQTYRATRTVLRTDPYGKAILYITHLSVRIEAP